MPGRTFALVSVWTVIAVIGALTVAMFVHDGLNARVVVSVLILAVFLFGVVGAMRHPDNE
jgi:cyanate permease